ncbi:hypothetical protein M9H77_30076 [Catharanthus roseus]|uniref:Uncharacterized protein n=1 Tax=Catharanthus roseus TaxID=4058 RepID=A0ACB9ZY70_CATRO|nr:hypothetical protein M9H77_30076 [Catharanthus roseus]
MEAKNKQEDYQSKLARDMHNFHHGGDNGFNAYGRRNHGHGNFIYRGHNGYGNFLPRRHSAQKKESELEKSERVKENECFIEKQENKKEEQREKEIVVVEKNEEFNFYANGTNSFFGSKSLCVQNFKDSSKDEGGKLAYKSIKTINFFSYLRFEIILRKLSCFHLFLFKMNMNFFSQFPLVL